MPSVTVEKANALRERLRENERMPQSEVKEWLLSEGVDAEQAGLIVGYGTAKNRNWWKKQKSEDGDELVWLDPAAKVNALPIEPETPLNAEAIPMSPPALQFAGMAVQLGIKEPNARAAAYYCFGSHDMEQPDVAWQALKDCPDLSLVNRKRLWRTWLSSMGITPDPALIRQVEEFTSQGASTTAAKGQAGQTPITAQRRFLAVNGEVQLVDSDDPGGMTFSEAMRVAQLQTEKARMLTPPPAPPPAAPPPPESPALSAMVTTMGTLTTELAKRPPDTARDEMVKLQIEMMKQDAANKHEQMMAEIRHREEMAEARRREDQDRFERLMEKQTEMIQAIGQNRSPWEEMDRFMPGLSQRFVDTIVNPPKPVPATFPFDFGNGQAIPMTMEGLTQWMNIQDKMADIQNKKEAIGLVRQNLPQLIELAKDWRAAIDRAAEDEQATEGMSTEPVEAQSTTLSVAQCVSCGGTVSYRARPGMIGFPCPYCGVKQTFEGEVIVDQEEEVVPAETDTNDDATRPDAEPAQVAASPVSPAIPPLVSDIPPPEAEPGLPSPMPATAETWEDAKVLV